MNSNERQLFEDTLKLSTEHFSAETDINIDWEAMESSNVSQKASTDSNQTLPTVVSFGVRHEKELVNTASNREETSDESNDLIGKKIAKQFNVGTFHGEVTKLHEDGTYRVEYYDGDSEYLIREELLQILDVVQDSEEYFQIQGILGHRGEDRALDLEVRWTDGSSTWEKLHHLRRDDPVTVATYVAEHLPQHKKLRKWAMKVLRVRRIAIRRAKANNNLSIRFKHGSQVPRSVREAFAIDGEMGD
ncbi:MAG: hypothetical protein AAGM67_16900, partial [Bacteroidota bacterium]